MKAGVGSFGSPSPKSKSRFPWAASALRRSSSSTERFFWIRPSTGFCGALFTGTRESSGSRRTPHADPSAHVLRVELLERDVQRPPIGEQVHRDRLPGGDQLPAL